jgi:hypothetical protein
MRSRLQIVAMSFNGTKPWRFETADVKSRLDCWRRPDSRLGNRARFSYAGAVIGFLRFIGVINAAIWLGAAIFFTLGAGPAIFSPAMKEALRLDHPYYPGAIAQVILARYFRFNLICAIIAMFHLIAEWLYMGRPARKLSLGLLGGLLAITLIGGFGLQPKLNELHRIRYDVKASPAERDAAKKTFGAWHGVAQVVNLFMIAGLIVYVWRTANPSETPRFVSSGKFRG